MIETTINAQTKNYLKEQELANFIKNCVFPNKYRVNIYNFFADVSTQDIEIFNIKYNITDNQLKKYYEVYIKDIYPNKILEEMIVYGRKDLE